MVVQQVAGQEFWRSVLAAGGCTRVPRWTRSPVAGLDEHRVVVPEDVEPGLRALALEMAVPLRVLVLAAHAKVLAALSAESEVATGYVTGVDAVLPCRLSTAPRSWRDLVATAHRNESEVLAHRHVALAELRREPGLGEPWSEAVFDALGSDPRLPEGTVLRLTVSDQDGPLGLRLVYSTEAIDEECAVRIAGYHLTALSLMAENPDADHARHTLLSPAELSLQVDGLAGPRRELPDRRVHELFEDQVRAHPDVVAAVQGDREWTYRQLNARANQLARAMRARGVVHESVVAVVTERNLDWMAAVLAVFKAGGAYLPIEPHFPGDRIAVTISRAGCGLVLTERGSTATLDRALGSLPGVERLLVDTAYEEGHVDADLGVDVAADQLAYIYFTSGSTGEPKGAMCEHAGMVNHLLAKIDDLGIGAGQSVAQTAPQCFDISLWQLVAAVLVGGRTVLVEQEVVLDVERFVDTIVDRDVAVLQVVPSYLEVVLSYLEHDHRDLPSLRCVSVTGEAVKKELVQRWFEAEPGIKLVNAYGLTETSDDTNHEVMDRPPEGDTVPLGRPVNNVRVYVVDEQLRPVPLGAPGLIAFSGVCVGRGYVNDPERTRACYLSDPHREGDRLYLGGDYGRWLPDGKLVFLGRRDNQVKIAGFRIEIGEIENTLLRVPGVRDGAVVVVQRPDRSKQLVAFYRGDRPLEVDALRERLGESLPAYMVPAAFHWRERLPLTANSKIDRSALTALAADLDVLGPDYQAPRTATERRLATAWATVLGIPQDEISRSDHFFDRGGTSLSAVRLAVDLDRAVSLKDVIHEPVLADLAALVDARVAATPASVNR